MLAHCVPLSGLLLLAPHVLDLIGEPSQLCAAVRHFMLLLLPLLWLDAIDRSAWRNVTCSWDLASTSRRDDIRFWCVAHVCRPLNGILVAQRISLPQMWISAAVLASHIVFCWCL